MPYRYSNAYAKGWRDAALWNVGHYGQWRYQWAVIEAACNAVEVVAIEANYDLENWRQG